MKRYISLMSIAILLIGCQTSEPTAQETVNKQTNQAQAPAWEVSPLFELTPNEEHVYQVRGVKDKLAIRGEETFSAGQHNKYLWFFWGDVTGKKARVVAVKEGSGEQVEQFQNVKLSGSLYGAAASVPSTLTLPSKGNWRLDVYLDDELFGSIIVPAR